MKNFAFLNTWPSSYESLERRHDFENDIFWISMQNYNLTRDMSDCKVRFSLKTSFFRTFIPTFDINFGHKNGFWSKNSLNTDLLLFFIDVIFRLTMSMILLKNVLTDQILSSIAPQHNYWGNAASIDSAKVMSGKTYWDKSGRVRDIERERRDGVSYNRRMKAFMKNRNGDGVWAEHWAFDDNSIYDRREIKER